MPGINSGEGVSGLVDAGWKPALPVEIWIRNLFMEAGRLPAVPGEKTIGRTWKSAVRIAARFTEKNDIILK